MQINSNDIHIINGTSAAGCWKQAFKTSSGLLIQCDILSFGPAPYCKDIKTWKSVRTHFLQNMIYEDYSFNLNESSNNLLTSCDRLKQADNIYLWISTGLSDQILLLFVAYLIKLTGAKTKSITLIQFVKSKHNKANFRGIGEINLSDMLNYPKPIILYEQDIDYCYQGWLAYTDETPDKFIDYLKLTNRNLIYLPTALKNILRHFPAKKSGLPLWDLILLKMIIKHSPKATRIIGYAMFDDDGENEVVGDAYLFQRLHHFADLPKPLVILSGNINQMRNTKVYLTDLGEKIAKELIPFHHSNPIDEWVGGVHLNPKNNNLWFYDGSTLEKQNNSSI